MVAPRPPTRARRNAQLRCRCVACKCSFCSLAVHTILAGAYLVLVLLYSRALINRCGNVALRRRARLLCAMLPALLLLQCVGLAVMVIRRTPYRWAHELGELAALLCVLALIAAVTGFLVVAPLRSAARALHAVQAAERGGKGGARGARLGVLPEASEGADLQLLPALHAEESSTGGAVGLDEPLALLPMQHDVALAGAVKRYGGGGDADGAAVVAVPGALSAAVRPGVLGGDGVVR